MNRPPVRLVAPFAAVLLLLTAACVAPPAKPEGAASVRTRLSQLQADPQLSGLAPVAMQEAEAAVAAAETPREDRALSRHLVTMADRKVDIAWARAQARWSENQRQTIAEQGEKARLDSRTREADLARSDAAAARSDAYGARRAAESARSDALVARGEADLARLESAAARQHSDDLRRQLEELNARTTERGLVVTLGDMLFPSGSAALKGGAVGDLGKLAAFLNQYPDRTAQIEGHTDSVGSADTNLRLSQRRAEAVKSYLVSRGVDSARITVAGRGEESPASSNDSSTGRQQNRRVEVIISDVEEAPMP